MKRKRNNIEDISTKKMKEQDDNPYGEIWLKFSFEKRENFFKRFFELKIKHWTITSIYGDFEFETHNNGIDIKNYFNIPLQTTYLSVWFDQNNQLNFDLISKMFENEMKEIFDKLIFRSNLLIGIEKRSRKLFFFQDFQTKNYIDFDSILQFNFLDKVKRNVSRFKNYKYYEITIVQLPNDYGTCFCCGVAKKDYHLQHALVGWKDGSIAYHNDNGCVYFDQSHVNEDDKSLYFEKFCQGDTVGVCLFFENENSFSVFFTKNGKPHNRKEGLFVLQFNWNLYFPTVTCADNGVIDDERRSEIIFNVNCGENTVKNPFLYDKFNVKPFKICENYYDIKINTQKM